MIDADGMAALHAAAFERDRPWHTDEFASLLSQKGVFALGDTDAFALIRVIAGEAELLTIATDPTRQRQGLALALMARWHAAAASKGAMRAILEVAEDNAPAIRLYDRCGYTECARRPGYYASRAGAPVDAILMDRALP